MPLLPTLPLKKLKKPWLRYYCNCLFIENECINLINLNSVVMNNLETNGGRLHLRNFFSNQLLVIRLIPTSRSDLEIKQCFAKLAGITNTF